MNKWIAGAVGFLVGGQVSAQQLPWPANTMPYVPLWVVPAPLQPMPPGFLPPQQVPFPMPFWLWYAPATGVVTLTEVKSAPDQVPPQVTPTQEPQVRPEMTEPDMAAREPEPTAKKPVSAPQTETLRDVQSTPQPEEQPRAEIKPVPSPEVAREAKALPMPAKAPMPGPKVQARKAPSTQPGAAARKPKTVKKTRKLCWKDGRLDVCE